MALPTPPVLPLATTTHRVPRIMLLCLFLTLVLSCSASPPVQLDDHSLHRIVHQYLRSGGQQRLQKLFNLPDNVIYNPLKTFTREHAYERNPDGSVVPRYLTSKSPPTSDLHILRAMGLHVPGVDPESDLITTDRQTIQKCTDGLPPVAVDGAKSRIIITYSKNVLSKPSVREPVELSVRKWADEFESDIPLRICFSWSPIGNETLGATSNAFLVRESWGRLRGDAAYTPALAASLQGVDPLGSGKDHVHMMLNSDIDWHYDIRTRAPNKKYDLSTTVLHELTHGLFFSGTIKAGETRNTNEAEFSQDKPGRFDQFMQVEDSIDVVRSCKNPTDLYRAVISPNLRFVDKESGTNFGLYAPFPFAKGSSTYHFNNTRSLKRDCARMGISTRACSDLMTHELVYEYTQRNLGETTLRVYRSVRSMRRLALGRKCDVPDYSSWYSTASSAGGRGNRLGPFNLPTWTIAAVASIAGVGAVVVIVVLVSSVVGVCK